MNLNKYLQQLDLAKLDLHPLNDHYIADHLNEQEKELYLTMVSSFVLFDDLTEARTRLFGLYLNSCKTKLQQGKIFNLAQNISKEQIKEFVKLCHDKSLIESFFVDAFIFSRIDKPILEKISHLFDYWVNLFKIEDAVIETIIYFVSNVFGLKSNYQLNYTFDIRKLNIWIPYCLEKFEINYYKKNHAYYIDKDQDFNFDLKIEDNIFVFKQDTKFKFSECDSLSIKSSNFYNALFKIENVEKILVEDSTFIGQYDTDMQYSLFTIDENSCLGYDAIENIIFKKNIFETSECRALFLNQPVIVKDCIFKNCGNLNLIGGAIYTTYEIRIINSGFDSCIAKIAGAIYCNKLDYKNSIKYCTFTKCLSLNYQNLNDPKTWNTDWKEKKGIYNGKLNAGAVWIDSSVVSTEAILDCTFTAANVYIKRSSHSYHACLVYRTKFVDSILSIGDSDQDISKDCSFEKGTLRLESTMCINAGELKI